MTSLVPRPGETIEQMRRRVEAASGRKAPDWWKAAVDKKVAGKKSSKETGEEENGNS